MTFSKFQIHPHHDLNFPTHHPKMKSSHYPCHHATTPHQPISVFLYLISFILSWKILESKFIIIPCYQIRFYFCFLMPKNEMVSSLINEKKRENIIGWFILFYFLNARHGWSHNGIIQPHDLKSDVKDMCSGKKEIYLFIFKWH